MHLSPAQRLVERPSENRADVADGVGGLPCISQLRQDGVDALGRELDQLNGAYVGNEWI
jgi:hypothetical protein